MLVLVQRGSGGIIILRLCGEVHLLYLVHHDGENGKFPDPSSVLAPRFRL